MVLTMTSQDTYYAPLITIGTTISEFNSLGYCDVCPDILFSICVKLRNADPGYDFTSSFFLRRLYEREEKDPKSLVVGFLKGPLLIRLSTFPVSLLYSHLIEPGLGISTYIHGSFLSVW
jgi:hypothetical protein